MVGEKFLNHLHLAKVHKPLEEQILKFAQRIREMFSPEDLRQYLEKMEHPEKPNDPDDPQDEDFLWNNNPVNGAEKFLEIGYAKELLLGGGSE